MLLELPGMSKVNIRMEDLVLDVRIEYSNLSVSLLSMPKEKAVQPSKVRHNR